MASAELCKEAGQILLARLPSSGGDYVQLRDRKTGPAASCLIFAPAEPYESQKCGWRPFSSTLSGHPASVVARRRHPPRDRAHGQATPPRVNFQISGRWADSVDLRAPGSASWRDEQMAAPRPARKDGVMSDRMEAPPRPSRAPVPRGQMPRLQAPGAPRRNRRRWAVAAALTVCWVVLWTVTGSIVAGALVLLFLAALGVVTVLALRALGVNRDHPWVRQIATRPWRDGQEVLQLALRHLPEVFVVTPSGALLAPSSVELRLRS